jgi:NAD(P)H dehydrogenase (quinone)
MAANQSKILVTGASGHLGALVLTHLTGTYGYPPNLIIATSRNPEGLAQWVELGVEVCAADFYQPESLVEAFKGAEKLLLVSTDSTDNEARLNSHLNAITAAKSAGVSHIFYTSMPQPDDSLVSFAHVHLETENAIKASGLTYTILRNSWYFENILGSIPGALELGTLYTAAGDGTISYLSRSDLAKAAAAALIATSGVDNVTLTLTGNESLSIAEVASKVSEFVGKPISVIQVPTEGIIEGAKAHGLPAPIAEMVASFDSASKAGHLSAITSDFETLTGKSPETFSVWLNENKALFASTH